MAGPQKATLILSPDGTTAQIQIGDEKPKTVYETKKEIIDAIFFLHKTGKIDEISLYQIIDQTSERAPDLPQGEPDDDFFEKIFGGPRENYTLKESDYYLETPDPDIELVIQASLEIAMRIIFKNEIRTEKRGYLFRECPDCGKHGYLYFRHEKDEGPTISCSLINKVMARNSLNLFYATSENKMTEQQHQEVLDQINNSNLPEGTPLPENFSKLKF